jgi:hypothetical protein
LQLLQAVVRCVTLPLQLLGDMMDKCGHAFRLQVAKKILPRLQVPCQTLNAIPVFC